jgi:drug/metabolite transporter (DMT)-like permease
MLFGTLILLVLAGGIHASSHALIKAARDKLAFSWWMLGISSVVGLPFFITSQAHDAQAWLIVLASGVCEAGYFLALMRAYSLGELSSVYPLARGSAPLLTALWAIAFLGERPSPVGFAGIALVVAGLYLVNLPSISHWRRPFAGFGGGAAPWALASGLLISGYSTIDKVAMRSFEPVAYLYFVLTAAWLLLALQWLLPARRAALMRELGGRAAAPGRTLDAGVCARLLAGSLLGFAAYVLVLTAMRSGPVSYVASVREIGVVFGAWIGIRFLSEGGGGLRIFAAGLVLAGIVTIAVAG